MAWTSRVNDIVVIGGALVAFFVGSAIGSMYGSAASMIIGGLAAAAAVAVLR